MDKKTLIEEQVKFVVERLYIPKFLKKIEPFLDEYKKETLKKDYWKREIGYEIALPPLVLDIKDEEQFLVKTLSDIFIINEENNKKTKWTFKKLIRGLLSPKKSQSALSAAIAPPLSLNTKKPEGGCL